MTDAPELTTLGSVVMRTGGMLQTGPFGSQLHASDYQSTGTPLVMPVNLGDNEIREGGIARIGTTDAHRLRRHALREGDIVFSRRGDVGRRSLVREKETGWLCGTGCLAARFGADRTAVSPAYVAEYLGSNAAQTWLVDNAVGGTMPNLNTGILAALPVLLPPKHEQDHIVSAFSDVQQTIKSLERLIAKKRAIKQGMMQQLLSGRTRLPGFTESWSEVSIYELANNQRSLFNDGDWIESEHITTAGNRLIQTGNIGVGRLLDRGTKRYVSDESFSALNCKEVVPGDILICRLAEPAGRACVVTTIGERRMLTSVDVSIYRPDPAITDRRFLVYTFSTPRWFQEVSERCGGSTRTRIARSELGRITAPIPCLEEQTRIADTLTDADSELDALEARLAKARAIKVGMMQQLLTGRMRLSVEAAS